MTPKAPCPVCGKRECDVIIAMDGGPCLECTPAWTVVDQPEAVFYRCPSHGRKHLKYKRTTDNKLGVQCLICGKASYGDNDEGFGNVVGDLRHFAERESIGSPLFRT